MSGDPTRPDAAFAEVARGVRLVAVDMDGTFLDAASEYDRERFARVHRRLAAAGIAFVVASGNQYFQLRSSFEGVPDVLYVAENGALIGTATELWRTSPWPPDAARAALAAVDALADVDTVACGVASAYVRRDVDAGLLALTRHYYPRLELVDDWADIDDDLVNLALLCPADRTDALVAELGGVLPAGIVPTSSGHGSIDLIGAGCTKGAALAWLGERLGVAASAMVAFGDGGNDVEMLAYVGHGVAMANAPEAIRARADAVAGRHDEAGVLTYLDRLLDVAGH